MSDKKSYPSAEELDLPHPGDPSPDATYFLGWQVQHNRLWLLCIFLMILLIGSVVVNFVQVQTYKPTTAFVTLDHGYPVIVNTSGEISVDGSVYRPVHLRSVVRSFIENRYGYNWQNLDKINRAIAFMSPAALEVERGKIKEADIANSIYGTKAVWRVEPDLDNWKVEAQGNGKFKVTVPGTAYINDNFRHTDPKSPFPKKFSIELTLGSTPLSEQNPYGYQVVETGRDIIF